MDVGWSAAASVSVAPHTIDIIIEREYVEPMSMNIIFLLDHFSQTL